MAMKLLEFRPKARKGCHQRTGPKGLAGFGALANANRPTDTPASHKKIPPETNTFIKRGPKFQAKFGCKQFFFPLTPSPRPRLCDHCTGQPRGDFSQVLVRSWCTFVQVSQRTPPGPEKGQHASLNTEMSHDSTLGAWCHCTVVSLVQSSGLKRRTVNSLSGGGGGGLPAPPPPPGHMSGQGQLDGTLHSSCSGTTVGIVSITVAFPILVGGRGGLSVHFAGMRLLDRKIAERTERRKGTNDRTTTLSQSQSWSRSLSLKPGTVTVSLKRTRSDIRPVSSSQVAPPPPPPPALTPLPTSKRRNSY